MENATAATAAPEATGLSKARARVFDDIRDLVAQADPTSWKKMWLDMGTKVPMSATSNRPYRGYNRFRLIAEAAVKGYSTNRWLTLGQIRKLEARVKDGEFLNPTIVELWAPKTSRKADDKAKPKSEGKKGAKKGGKKSEKVQADGFRSLMYRWYKVWNVEQCEGLPDNVMNGPKRSTRTLDLSYAKVDALVLASGASVEYGHDKACFIPSLDRVLMPDKHQFNLGESDEVRVAHFYATLLHEMVHWTGLKPRLDRLTLAPFGSTEYAKEELVAEMGSAFLCADLGVPMDDVQHPEYLANWLQRLKDEPSALTTAASKASQASDYLLKMLGAEDEEPEEEAEEAKAESTETVEA